MIFFAKLPYQFFPSMLKRITLSICCLFCISTLSNKVCAQTSADSLNNKLTAYDNTVDKFNAALGPGARLYNGEEYDGYYPGIVGNAYFLDATGWGTGTVTVDGYTFKNVKIRYDLYKDLVIVPLYNSFLTISLLNERLGSFDVFGHHFIYIKNNPAVTGAVHSGIYDELYGGKIQVLCKRSKSIQQDHGTNAITTYFLYSADYYIFKNNQYFTVSSKGDMLAVLKDKKRQLQQFIRSNKLKFNKTGKEQAMAKVAEYYDRISQ
jgi:hypothetical protein